MLAKLIKYDIKSLNRFLPAMHLFILLSSILIRIFITGRINPQVSREQADILLLLFFILYFTIIVALSTGTYLIIGIRFYKNLFTDEGYLTRTLPVTSGSHLLSKTVAGSLWAIINMFSVYLCTYIVAATPYVKSTTAELKDEFMEVFGFTGKYAGLSFSAALAVLVLLSCFDAVASIIMIYASVAFGQLFSSHRVLGAVVSYFVISVLMSVLSVVVMILFGHESRLVVTASSIDSDFNFIAYMIEVMKISGVLTVVTSIILYAATHYIMRKKINLI